MGEWGYAHSKAHISMPEDKRQPSWPTERDQAVELKEVAVSQTHSYPHKLTTLAGTKKATEGHRAGTQKTNIYLNRCPTSLADAAAVIQQPFERPFTRAKRWKQEPLRQWMQLVACSKKFFPNYFFSISDKRQGHLSQTVAVVASKFGYGPLLPNVKQFLHLPSRLHCTEWFPGSLCNWPKPDGANPTKPFQKIPRKHILVFKKSNLPLGL